MQFDVHVHTQASGQSGKHAGLLTGRQSRHAAARQQARRHVSRLASKPTGIVPERYASTQVY